MLNMSERSIDKEAIKIGNILLLLAIFSTIFLIPLFPIELHSTIHGILITVIFLMTVIALGKDRKMILYIVIFLIAIEWISASLELLYLTGFSRLAIIFFFTFVVFRLIFQAARSRDVNLNVVLESINGYLLLGIVFSIMVKIFALFSPDAYNFTAGAELDSVKLQSMSEFYYYGFVTYTTLGYGDILPQHPQAKSLAILISICGQIYVAVIIAMLVGKYASRDQSKS